MLKYGHLREGESMVKKRDAGHPVALKKAIGYRPCSIVSREFIRNDRGTLTLFAFDKDQGLSEHTAPFDAVVYIVDGRARVTIAGRINHVKAGDMIIMPANKPHSVLAVNKFKMLLTLIKGSS